MSRVNVLNPQGDIVSLPSEDVSSAYEAGYQPLTQDKINEVQSEQTYGGTSGELISGALGAASGATLGLSNVALTKSGLLSKEALKGFEETNPRSYITGEVGSAFIPLPGGVASAVGKIGKNVTGAIKAAKVAEEATAAAKVLGAVGDIGAHALGSAVEGAIYSGVGNTLNEYALGDPELNGQKILSHIGHGAALGGALGGSMRAAAIGIPASLKAAKDGIVKVRDHLIGTGENDAGLVGKALGDENKISQALANRTINLDKDEAVELIQQTTSKLNDVNKNVQTTIKELNQDLRPKETEALINTAHGPRVDGAVQSTMSQINETIKLMRSEPELYSPAAARRLELIRDGLVRDVTDEATTLDKFNKLRDAKKQLQDIVFSKVPSAQETESIGLLNKLRGGINDTLKNPEVFGFAGSSLASHDEALSKFYKFIPPSGKMTEFQKNFMRRVGQGPNSKWEFDQKKVETAFKQGNTLRGQEKMALLDEFWNTLRNMPDHLENTVANVPNSAYDKGRLSKILANAEDDVISSHEKYVNAIGNQKNKLGMGELIPAAIATSHPIIGAAMSAYNIATKPVETLNKLAEIERLVGKSTQAINKGAKAVFESGSKFMPKTYGAVGRGAMILDADSHDKKREEIMNMASDPDYAIDKLNKATEHLQDAAPGVASSVQQSMIRANQFLASKLPAHDENPFSTKYTPSKTDVAQFNRYLDLVEKPLSAFDQVRNNTITPETTETLQAVYPALFTQMKTSLLKSATDKISRKQTIPFQTKQSISMFLGQPLVEALMPQSVMSYQQAYVPQPGTQGQGQQKTSTVGLREMDPASRVSLDGPDDNGE